MFCSFIIGPSFHADLHEIKLNGTTAGPETQSYGPTMRLGQKRVSPGEPGLTTPFYVAVTRP